MQTGLYVALSAQTVLENRIDAIANNIANLGTIGFRAEEVTFETFLSEAGQAPVAFASTGESYFARRSGAIKPTGNPLDVAVNGEAFLAIETPAGPAYTRDGRMMIDSGGQLTSIAGYPVLDAGGAPIQLDAAGGEPVIARDGTISQGGVPLAALGLFELDAAATLTRFENSGLVSDLPVQAVTDPATAGVAQGFVEEANVNPVLELTQLISLSRAFESISAAIRESEGSLDEAIQTLGQTT